MDVQQQRSPRNAIRTTGVVAFVSATCVLYACSSPPAKPTSERREAPKPALHAAIDAGDAKKVTALLRDGADIEEIYIGRTPLNAAVLMDRAEIVAILLDAGANMETVDHTGLTPLFLANSEALLKPFIAHGANLNQRSEDGSPLLIAALYHGWTAVAMLLIDHGADVSAQDRHGATPLMVAAVTGADDVVAKLLSKGVDVNQKTGTGRTALLSAAYTGQLSTAKLLLSAGADVNAQDAASGDTSLHYCAVDGYVELAKLLLSRGADPRIKNRRGETPLQAGETWSPYPGRVVGHADKQGVISLLKSAQ